MPVGATSFDQDEVLPAVLPKSRASWKPSRASMTLKDKEATLRPANSNESFHVTFELYPIASHQGKILWYAFLDEALRDYFQTGPGQQALQAAIDRAFEEYSDMEDALRHIAFRVDC